MADSKHRLSTMSPIKRALAEQADSQHLLSPKRLRGGGFEDDDMMVDESELFEDDELEAGAEQYIPEEILQEADKVVTANDKQRWKRPDVDPNLNNKKDLNLQWLDMDVVSGPALTENPNRSQPVAGRKAGEVPILRTFGVEENGHSVTVFIHGYTPYAYFALPPGYECDEACLPKIRETLTDRLKSQARGAAAVSAEVLGVSYIDDHRSIMGYDTPHTKFLKIYVSLPGLVPTLKRIMEDGIELSGIIATAEAAETPGMLPVFSPFECNVPFVLRFMVDRDISGAGWLTLPAETYQIRSADKKETHCQVSVDRCAMFCNGHT